MTTTDQLAAALRQADATMEADGYHQDHSTRWANREALARYDAEQALYTDDGTAQPLAERKARILDWLINNLLTDSQLDVRPPGMSGALRFTRSR